ncbi:MAG: sigma-70 family RNA polymerase sigma factor [Acidobacteriaceae bacterium]|nr:sigma-70 family RNA polymerase sigma factor [Acidobacteriaceae bacterium]
MTNFLEVGPDVLFDRFIELQKLFGFIPNLFRVQAPLSRVIEAEAGIIHAIPFHKQVLPRGQRLLTVATAHRNTYCFTAFYEVLHSLRVRGIYDEAILETILATALSGFLCTLSNGLDPAPDFEPRTIPFQNTSSSAGYPGICIISGPYLIDSETDLIQTISFYRAVLHFLGMSRKKFQRTTETHNRTGFLKANQAFLDFSLELALRPCKFGGDDTRSLRRHGFTKGQTLKAVVATALNNCFGTLQRELGTASNGVPKRALELQDTHRLISNKNPSDDGQIDPDAALVTRVQDGNADAFEELLARHSCRVYRTLVSIIGNVEEAQDALQETFLKVLMHIDNFQRRSKFSTWLTSIANNIAFQRLRDQRRLESLGDAENESEFALSQARTWDANPEQLYSQAERRRLVESGLMKMPSKYRAVLVLRDIKQLSTEEAATTLGLGIPALKARLFRARRMLREALSPHFAVSAQRIEEHK